jgi:hypothetical protein
VQKTASWPDSIPDALEMIGSNPLSIAEEAEIIAGESPTKPSAICCNRVKSEQLLKAWSISGTGILRMRDPEILVSNLQCGLAIGSNLRSPPGQFGHLEDRPVHIANRKFQNF